MNSKIINIRIEILLSGALPTRTIQADYPGGPVCGGTRSEGCTGMKSTTATFATHLPGYRSNLGHCLVKSNHRSPRFLLNIVNTVQAHLCMPRSPPENLAAQFATCPLHVCAPSGHPPPLSYIS